MTTVARLNNDGLLLSGELDERLPAITSGLVSHYPLDDSVQGYVPLNIRYVRDWLNGSTANAYNHWNEIQVIDFDGTNRALGLTATSNAAMANPAFMTDGIINASYSGNSSSVLAYAQLDLGALYSIKEIKVWHYYPDGRTYNSTKTEVSEDGIIWYAIFDSAVEGLYVETVTGKTHNMSSLGTTVNPSTNTNTTLTPEGLAVEEGTTNIWTGGFTAYNNYGVPTSVTPLNETYLGQTVYRFAFTVDDAHAANLAHFQTSLSSHGVYGGGLSWVENVLYTSSIFWRPVNKQDMVFGGTASNTAGWSAGPTDYLDDGWRRYYRHRTGAGVVTKSDVVHHSFYCPSLSLNETIYFDVCCAQTEQGRTFPTSYVNGSRAAGDFKINTPSLSSECTINFDYKCRERVSNTVISNSNFNFWWGLYLNASGALYTHQANGGSSHTSSYIMPLNQWVNITIKWTAILQSYYADGVLLGSLATVGSTNSANIPVLSLGYGWNVGNATFKNLSIYNRALSDAEVTTLAKNKFKLLPSGNLINEITEQPPIPSDALYVPLGFDASSELGDIVPSENTAVHEENAVFSGQVATNSVVNNGQTTTPWSGDGTPTLSVVDSNTLFRGRKVTRYKPGTSGNCYINGAGDVRTDLLSVNWAVTCYMKRVDGTPITGINSYLYVNGNTNVNIAANIEEVEDGWIKITRERTGLVSGYVTLMGFYGMVNAAEYLIANWSIEPTPFQTPFFETTRPVASLEYNLNDSISMDWSGNWTLAYWKKPVGTYTGLLTGYNLESLGCNSNSVGGSYIWFGKINGANNIAISSANGIVGFATADYFNKWQYVVLRKSGTTVTYNVYLENGNVSTSSVTNAPTANGYVTQYGYDFKMGGWDNGNQGNTYYKDFVIVPSRAISDAEIQTIYNTKMRAYSDTINISNQVIEGATL